MKKSFAERVANVVKEVNEESREANRTVQDVIAVALTNAIFSHLKEGLNLKALLHEVFLAMSVHDAAGVKASPTLRNKDLEISPDEYVQDAIGVIKRNRGDLSLLQAVSSSLLMVIISNIGEGFGPVEIYDQCIVGMCAYDALKAEEAKEAA